MAPLVEFVTPVGVVLTEEGSTDPLGVDERQLPLGDEPPLPRPECEPSPFPFPPLLLPLLLLLLLLLFPPVPPPLLLFPPVPPVRVMGSVK
ncbi:hypothetical protein ABZ552_19270, partial [Nocardia sp. NPDC019219]|uniref:hypothetical protein n=1 Tax=Nocardia sp. NPDC019219 TaxID=3154590 RepID=UPI0033EADD65